MVEQLAPVLERCPEPLGPLLDAQGQVKGQLARLAAQNRNRQAGLQLQPALAGGRIFASLEESEGHLEERRALQAALRRELFDQPLEGQILMLIRVEDHPPYPANGLAVTRLPGEVGAQHAGVDEETDQLFDLPPVAASDGRADGEVVLAGGAPKQGLEEATEKDEPGGLLLPADAIERGD